MISGWKIVLKILPSVNTDKTLWVVWGAVGFQSWIHLWQKLSDMLKINFHLSDSLHFVSTFKKYVWHVKWFSKARHEPSNLPPVNLPWLHGRVVWKVLENFSERTKKHLRRNFAFVKTKIFWWPAWKALEQMYLIEWLWMDTLIVKQFIILGTFANVIEIILFDKWSNDVNSVIEGK